MLKSMIFVCQGMSFAAKNFFDSPCPEQRKRTSTGVRSLEKRKCVDPNKSVCTSEINFPACEFDNMQVKCTSG